MAGVGSLALRVNSPNQYFVLGAPNRPQNFAAHPAVGPSYYNPLQ
jgi:hypothetical protein